MIVVKKINKIYFNEIIKLCFKFVYTDPAADSTKSNARYSF